LPISSQKTIRELVNDISFRFAESDIFYGHGTSNAFDEAVYLVFTVLDLAFDIGDDQMNREIDSNIVNRIDALVRRRITQRIPVAYLINKAWFSGLPFYVDERVLIPRSPIAELIEERFTPWLDPAVDINNILDIGTGSGCIAIAGALAFPHASVDAIDISRDALEVARINLETYKLGEQVRLIESDLYQKLAGKTYELIIANPPYVDVAEMNALPAEYRYEPAVGLESGTDGLAIVKRIISESGQYLSDKGILVVEVGNGREAVEAAFPAIPFTWLEFERGGEGVFLLSADKL
jgi:ribosomal protein L3 glutamine methyltransferase